MTDLIPVPPKPGLPWWLSGDESTCNPGDLGLIPELQRSSRAGHGNLLQYSCLENSMDRRTWQATVLGITSVRHDLWLNNTTTTTQAWFLSRTHSIKHLTYGKGNRVLKCASLCQPPRATFKYMPQLNRKLANVITLWGLWQRVKTIKY